MEWFLLAFKKFSEFNGRSRRKEFWMFNLISVIISTILTISDNLLGLTYAANGLLSSIFSLIVLVPSFAVHTRRLHDINKSGWYFLLWFLPIIGWIWVIVLLAKEGDQGKNEYGSDPKNEIDELEQIGVQDN